MREDASKKVHALPLPEGAEVLPVSFKKKGRPKKAKPENVVEAPIDPPPVEEVSSNLKKIVLYNEKGEAMHTGLFEIPGQYGFYVRPYHQGRQRKKKLDVPLIEDRDEAIAEALSKRRDFMEDLRLFQRGKVDHDPFQNTREKTVSDLCAYYIRLGYPRSGTAPTGKELDREKKRVEWLMKWGKNKLAKEISLEDCREYAKWRRRHVNPNRGDGGAMIRLELVTLSNVFLQAMRNKSKTGISVNPIYTGRENFEKKEEIRHCVQCMPRNADELHTLARYLFQEVDRQVYGWLTLFQAMIGHRIGTMRLLRMDAKEGEPGWVGPDPKKRKKTYDSLEGQILDLFRSKTKKASYGHIEIFPELGKVIEAHRLWHRQRFPAGNPWYFPSHYGGEVVSADGLTKALQRAAVEVGQPERTSHGLRSYRGNVLMQEGMEIWEIALRLGQKTGGKVFIDVYGEGSREELGYLPRGEIKPAWEMFLPKEERVGPKAEQEALDLAGQGSDISSTTDLH